METVENVIRSWKHMCTLGRRLCNKPMVFGFASRNQPRGVAEMEGLVNLASQNEATEESISERRLWTAVLVMAVEDWRDGTLRARRAAQQFLFENDRDFNEVCAGAGLDPQSFRTKLLKIGRRIEMQGPLAHPLAA